MYKIINIVIVLFVIILGKKSANTLFYPASMKTLNCFVFCLRRNCKKAACPNPISYELEYNSCYCINNSFVPTGVADPFFPPV
jgi:hypothetical protein